MNTVGLLLDKRLADGRIVGQPNRTCLTVYFRIQLSYRWPFVYCKYASDGFELTRN